MLVRSPLRPQRTSFSELEIRELVSQTQIQEAIYLASPSLYTRMQQWLDGRLKKEKEPKLLDALYKYLMRMHTRCTPFGLFAGCTVGEWGDKTKIEFVNDAPPKRFTRLDMNYLCALAQHLEKQTELRPYLKYYPNSSLLDKGDILHYVEYFYRKSSRYHRVNAVDFDSYLQVVLQTAISGQTIAKLSEALIHYDAEITEEESYAYINAIIDAQLLVSELEPALTGPGMLTQIIDVLEKATQQNPIWQPTLIQLQQLRSMLAEMDDRGINEQTDYRAITGLVEQLGVPFDPSKLLQTDLRKPAKTVQLNRQIQTQLKQCLRFLDQLPAGGESKSLLDFINAFYQRYEDREMPLLEVLDTQWGIGYPVTKPKGDTNPLTKDIVLPKGPAKARNIKWTAYETFMFETLLAHRDDAEVDLSKLDTQTIQQPSTRPLMDALYCMFRLLDEDRLHLQFASGSSGINLVSRFGYADPEVTQLLKDLVVKEDAQTDEDCVIAEIIHLPEARTGNILAHPDVRSYEIPYLGRSAKSEACQIPLKDILVSVNPMSRRIILRSKRLNKIIIPRLSNAHNYAYKSLPVYHFLCDMQFHKKRRSLLFSRSSLGQYFKKTPRFVWKNIILQPAIWFLKKKDYVKLNIENIAQFRKEYSLPEKIVLLEGDNELLFDLTQPLSARIFIQSIKKWSAVEISEYLSIDNNVQDSFGEVCHNEIIAFLQKEKRVEKKKKSLVPKKEVNYPSGLFLGSSWLYYKIYTDTTIADQILSNQIDHCTQYLLQKGWIDQWFFIRFNDPEDHLRFRVKINQQEKIGDVINYLHQVFKPLVASGTIHKIQTDTYKPEILRYGETTMALSEQWFMHDSQATVKMLQLVGDDIQGTLRWLYTLRAIDELLNQFSYSLKAKKQLLGQLKMAYAREFKSDKFLRKQLTNKYRESKSIIFQILKPNQDPDSKMAPLWQVLELQRKAAYQCITEIKTRLEMPLDNLLTSYIHMLVNRIFQRDQRKCELIIYDFLSQYYTTQSILAEKAQDAKSIDYAVSKL